MTLQQTLMLALITYIVHDERLQREFTEWFQSGTVVMGSKKLKLQQLIDY